MGSTSAGRTCDPYAIAAFCCWWRGEGPATGCAAKVGVELVLCSWICKRSVQDGIVTSMLQLVVASNHGRIQS